MLVHLIEERKTEYGIRMICGASRKDICINIMLPVAAIICTSSVPSIVLCNNLYEYLLQLIAILLMNGLVAAFPIMHWLKKTDSGIEEGKIEGVELIELKNISKQYRE